MSADTKPSNEYSEPARTLGRDVEFKRSSRQQQSSNAVKEKILPIQAHQRLKFHKKLEVINPFVQLSADHHPDGLRQQMDDELVIRKKSSVGLQKQQLASKTNNKDDELVKHMSNLPGYLQRVEKQKNVQVQALNFGVLDWKRLEKWKYNERMPARSHPKVSSSGKSVDIENGKSALSKTSVGRQQPSVNLHLNSVTEMKLCDDVQQSKGKLKNIQYPQTPSGRTTAGQKNDYCQKVKNPSSGCPQMNHEKGKKKEADWTTSQQKAALSLDQMENSISMSSLPMCYQQGKIGTGRDDDINGSPIYSNAELQNIVLLMPKCPSKRCSSQNSRLLESRISPNEQLTKDARDRYSDCFSSHKLQSGELYNEIPCLFPMPASVATARDRKPGNCVQPRNNNNSINSQSSEAKCSHSKLCNVGCPVSVDTCEVMELNTAKETNSRTSSHGQLADNNRLSYSDDFSSQELQKRELQYEIPHSCPLPGTAAISQGREPGVWTYPFQCDTSSEPRSSRGTCPEAKCYNLDDSVSVESFKGMNLDFAKHTADKRRHPSPNRRFSFSFGRISRSFSFKESSAVPALSSTPIAAKSSRENPEVFAAIDDSKMDKANASGRRRPSPFRRLLDPILKSKVAHSTEAVQSKGAISAETFQVLEKNSSFGSVQPISNSKPLFNETNQASPVQALMQLTVKNGLPFFKFVVDNRSDILAAAVNQLPTSGKVDRTLTFSFYSVHEIKKKSGGWITNGSKEKHCGFGYDIVGKMKTSRSFFSELNADGCNDQFMVIESVLFDVDVAEGNKGAPEVSPNRELAAIIFKEPVAKCNNRESIVGRTREEKGFLGSSPGSTYGYGEKENFSSMTVILPGGFHSLPKDGAPSSLIQRWNSGGSCDCGGWDVGCKLKVLANQKKGSNSSIPAMSCSTLHRMNLFIQDGEGKGQPIFSLAPFKDGFHSIEFDASVSLLEAFSVCVAVIMSRDLSDIFDGNLLPEAKVSVEAKNEDVDTKNTSINPGEVAPKYVSSPPPSPVGRI